MTSVSGSPAAVPAAPVAVPGSPSAASLVRRLVSDDPVEPREITAAFESIMAGEATQAQISAILVGLRLRGESAAHVAAVVRALRGAMVELPASHPDSLVDTCGTGGGTISTFNISTAAALVAAGAGVRIAKHGNRSFTSRCGSADVLEALGVSVDVSVDAMVAALEHAGIVFMFAPLMHPAMRHVGPVRRELGIHTVMNVVGPLANPARAGRQVIGVAEERRVPVIAGAIAELGSVHTLVVHGAGMDEISPLAETKVIEIRDGDRRYWTIDPARYGIAGVTQAELAGGDPAQNAELIERILAGDGPPGATAAVLLNAAAAIYVGGAASSLEAGMEEARAALSEGKGAAALGRLRAALPRKT